jgi:hypothetical protein
MVGPSHCGVSSPSGTSNALAVVTGAAHKRREGVRRSYDRNSAYGCEMRKGVGSFVGGQRCCMYVRFALQGVG